MIVAYMTKYDSFVSRCDHLTKTAGKYNNIKEDLYIILLNLGKGGNLQNIFEVLATWENRTLNHIAISSFKSVFYGAVLYCIKLISNVHDHRYLTEKTNI